MDKLIKHALEDDVVSFKDRFKAKLADMFSTEHTKVAKEVANGVSGTKESVDLDEAKIPAKGTLYVKNSSIFDSPSNKYDIALFSKTLKDAGAKKVWKDNAFGWSNQPEVVLFTGIDAKKASAALEKLPVFKKGVIISDANNDWDQEE